MAMCMWCHEKPATHHYDDWGIIFCCLECGQDWLPWIEQRRPAPTPRVLTPIGEGLLRVDREES